MGFMESYKHLNKLCGEVLNDPRGVSAYIDEMQSQPRGTYLVRLWDEDLKRLRHCRRVRNQIAHEPDCSEENMCVSEDTAWLDDFYDRIMDQNDPLALYRTALRPKPASKPARVEVSVRPPASAAPAVPSAPPHPVHPAAPRRPSRPKRQRGRLAVWIVLLILAMLTVAWLAWERYAGGSSVLL